MQILCPVMKEKDLPTDLSSGGWGRSWRFSCKTLSKISVMSSLLPPLPEDDVVVGQAASTEEGQDSDSCTSEGESQDYELRFSEGRSCRLCQTVHSIKETACPTANWFVSTDEALRTRFAKADCGIAPGAVVLSVIQEGSRSVLRTCTFGTKLCEACEDEAIKKNNKWHRRTGECDNSRCSNYETCDCFDDVHCVDYVFMPTCSHQNLPDEELAVAVEAGRVRIVSAVQEQTMWIRETAVAAKDEAKQAFRNEEPITLAELADAVVCLEEELLVIAMYDERLAAFLDSNKSFTLSKVNGFVETPGPREIGPWLSGRLVKDDYGQMWHLPTGRPVAIRTEGDVSRVMEMKGDVQESDPLGTYII